MPELQFAAPKNAAFLERHGAALVAESFHEKEALALIASLRASRAASASVAGLLSIEAINSGSDGSSAESWRFTAENLPLVKTIEAELDRL